MTTTDVSRHGIGPLGTQNDPCCHPLALMMSGVLTLLFSAAQNPLDRVCRVQDLQGALTPLAVTSTLQSTCGHLQAKWA